MQNPYEKVSWENEQVKSFSHMHVISQEWFDLAVADGYKHFAISHYQPSKPMYPLQNYFTNVPQYAIGSPNTEKVKFKDDRGHINSLGSFAIGHGHEEAEPTVTWREAVDEILAQLQFPDGGGVTLNHPVDWNVEKRSAMLDYDPRVLGIEIYNRGSAVEYGPAYLHDSLAFWDRILATGRRCYGFCVVDWQVDKYKPYFGSNILIPDEVSEHGCLKAYREGAFYGQMLDLGLRFTGIKMDGANLTVKVTKPSTIIFTTNMGAILRQPGRSATCPIPTDATFIRVEAIDSENEQSHIFSNPIMLKTPGEAANEALKFKKYMLLLSE